MVKVPSWGRALVVCAVALVAFGPPLAIAAGEPQASSPAPADPTAESGASYRVEREIRSHFGFDTSDSAIQAAAADADGRSGVLPIPLRRDERDEMSRRTSISNGLVLLIEEAEAAQFPELGAMKFDDRTGQLAIGLTQDTPRARKRVADALPAGTTYAAYAVPYSWEELNGLAVHLGADMPALQAEGLVVVRASHDWAAGTMTVAVDSARSRAGYGAELRRRYGSALTITATDGATGGTPAWSRQATSGPVIGGQRIFINNGGTSAGVYCVATGGARRPSDGHLWLVTAGHCAPIGRHFYQGQLTGTYLGSNPVSAPWAGPTTNCDCLVVDNNTPAQLNHYVLDAYVNLQAETSVYTAPAYAPGVPVCYSSGGPTNGVRCGSMTGGASVLITLSFPGYANQSVTLTDQVFSTNMLVCKGDSGSPVFTGNTWAGIVSGLIGSISGTCTTSSTTNPVYFTKIVHLPEAYQLQMLTYDP